LEVLKTRQGNISPQGIYISLEFDAHHQENFLVVLFWPSRKILSTQGNSRLW